jgi:signal transduction histidine kinase
VRIRLETIGGEICLEIADNGRGMAAAPGMASNRRGLGLTGMRARARSAGGELRVRSRPGEGVVIEVRAPLHDETHSHPIG